MYELLRRSSRCCWGGWLEVDLGLSRLSLELLNSGGGEMTIVEVEERMGFGGVGWLVGKGKVDEDRSGSLGDFRMVA